MSQTVPQSLDCTDIKVLLSGLIDDEIEPQVRHLAERHLTGCSSCRELIAEAEALDALIRADTELLEREGLPAGFENRVLRRAGHGGSARPYWHHWTTWSGWAAAAAALGLALTIWVLDRRAGMTIVPMESGDQELVVGPAVYSTGAELRSSVLAESGPADTTATERAPGEQPPSTSSDADTIHAAAILLGIIKETSVPAELNPIREALVYDELAEPLADACDRLPPADRSAVLEAESVFLDVLHDPLVRRDITGLRRRVIERTLTRSLQALSDRGDEL